VAGRIEGFTRRDRIRNEEIFNRLKEGNNRQTTEQAAAILWTSEQDEK